MARVARSPEEQEELFDLSEEISTLATTIRANRIGLEELNAQIEKIKSGTKRISLFAALADMASLFLMFFALGVRHPMTFEVLLLNLRFALFLSRQWKQAKEFFLLLKAETWNNDMPQRASPVPSH
jgi:hypothetical protein